MLRITTSRNPQGAVDYFTNALSQEDYFFKNEVVQAHWEGKTAKMLGLEGKEVTKDVFSNLVKNIHPVTGERLTVRNAANRKAGYEYCFNAPKSLSVYYALNNDEDVLHVYKMAVHQTMAEIEAYMQTQVTRDGVKYHETTGNIIMAAFHHMTSRPVETKQGEVKMYVSDPSLHTHVFVPNLSFHEDSNRFQALEEGRIRRLAPYFEAGFHARLSHGLRELGFSIERTHDRWEIVGISKAIRDKNSNRTKQIEKIAKEKGITNAEEKAALGARTRIKKEKGVSEESLVGIWRDRLSRDELVAVKQSRGFGIGKAERIEAKEAVDKALKHWFERNSAAPEERILATALSFGYGTLLPENVRKELNGRDNILKAERDTIQYITTKEMVHAEEKMLSYAVNQKGLFPPLNAEYEITDDFLNEQQRQAIQAILTNNDGVQLIRGFAGSGKTTLLERVKDGIELNGGRLIATAPSAQASRGVLRSKGFEQADTISKLLVDMELQESIRGNVLLVDEAGLVSTNTMNDIFQLAKEKNARVLLSGDQAQLSSVQAGSPFKQLQDKAQLSVASVDKIVRQKPEQYRGAVELLSKGLTQKAIDKLDSIGAVHEIEDSELRYQTIANRYVESLEKGQSTLVVSPTHSEGEIVTQHIREKLKQSGRISQDEKPFMTQRNFSYTETERGDPASYGVGMIVQFTQNQKGGFKAGSRYEVLERPEGGDALKVKCKSTGQALNLPIDQPENFQVFSQRETQLAEGDKILISGNGKTLEKTKVNNGQTYEVKGFTEDGHVKLNTGKTLNRDYGNFKHGFVQTSYAVQGKTARHVIHSVSADSYPASNQKEAYVSLSRGTHEVTLITDSKADLKRVVSRSGERLSALEIADEHYARQMTRNREQYHSQQNERTLTNGRERKERTQIAVSEPKRSMDRE